MTEPEFEGVVDVFENDDIVITKASYKSDYIHIINTDVAVKNLEGEIVKIITIKTDVADKY